MPKRDGLYRRDDSPYWWISSDPITGKPESTRRRDREAARTVLRTRERLAADPAALAATRATLGDACARFLAHRRETGKYTGFYEVKLGWWCRVLGHDFPLSEMRPAAFDRFVSARRADGVTGHTISKEVGCALVVLRAEKRAGRYVGDLDVLRPADLVVGYVPRTRALSPAELAALLGQLAPERGAFVALCVGLGLRKSEAFGLVPEDFNFEAGTVNVRGTKTAGARRVVAILDSFRGLIKAGAEHVPLKPWARGNITRDLAVACKNAGIVRVTPNDLRRTFATLLSSAGVDRDAVRRLMGHAKESTMLETVYDKPTTQQLVARMGGDLVKLSGELTTSSLRSGKARPAHDGIEHDSSWAGQGSNLRHPACKANTGYTVAGGVNENSDLDTTDGTGRAPVPSAETTSALRGELILGTLLRARADALAFVGSP
jgi:integrase